MEKKNFGYPQFDENGEEILTTYDNEYSEMMMDVRVYRMKKDQTRSFERNGEETAFLLMSGEVEFVYDGKCEKSYRKDVFTDGPYALHVCSGKKVEVKALSDAEILVQCTKNDTVRKMLHGPIPVSASSAIPPREESIRSLIRTLPLGPTWSWAKC